MLTIAAQFAVGYTMETDGGADEGRCDVVGNSAGEDPSEAAEERLDRREERCEAEQERTDDDADDALATAWSDLGSGDLFGEGLSLPEAHVVLGLVVIALGVLRLVWRRATPLPPWDPRLTPADQKVVHATEVSLLALQFLVPATGVLLVVGTDDLAAVHIAAHVAFFVALAVHLGMVVGKRLVRRMLPGAAPRPVPGGG